MTSARRLTDTLLTVAFLAAIGVPFIGSAFHPKALRAGDVSRERNRSLETPNGLHEWETYPQAFERYYEKHFGFRDALVRTHSLIQVKALGISTTPRVMLGKDGWLFFHEDNAIESYRDYRPLTDEALGQWKRSLEARRDWLARRKCAYLLVLVPNPPTIYPEYLPDGIRRTHNESALDQLTTYLKERSDVPVLDLRPALRAVKARHRVYHRTDTHWNDLGAFVGYTEIMRRVKGWFPEAQPDPISNYTVEYRTETGGDLAWILGLPESLKEEAVHLTPRAPRSYTRSSQGQRMDYKYHYLEVTECPQGDLPGAVILRDSFGNALIPYLSRRFRRAAYVWTKGFPPDVIERERPAVVIQEIIERHLLRSVEEMAPDPIPPPPPAPRTVGEGEGKA